MTRLADRVARRVLGSRAFGTDLLVYVAGVELPVRGTSVVTEREAETDAGRFVTSVHEVRVPISAFTEMPEEGDQVEIDGAMLSIVSAKAEMASVLLRVSSRRAD